MEVTMSSPTAAGRGLPLRIGRVDVRRCWQLRGRAALGWSAWFGVVVESGRQLSPHGLRRPGDIRPRLRLVDQCLRLHQIATTNTLGRYDALDDRSS
jgi:hypothetical protein